MPIHWNTKSKDHFKSSLMFHNIFGDGSRKGNADPKEPFIFYKEGVVGVRGAGS